MQIVHMNDENIKISYSILRLTFVLIPLFVYFQILVLTDSQRVILVALIPPIEFKIRQAGLIR